MKEKKLSKKEYRYYKCIEVMLRKVYTHNIRYHVCYLAVWFHIYTHTHTKIFPQIYVWFYQGKLKSISTCPELES